MHFPICFRIESRRDKAASVWPQPKRIGAGRLPRVFSAGAEARHTPRRSCGLPHGLGGSAPSPCAPPRQAGWLGSIGHCVEGSRQRKFGFPTKLPGRKRPTSGDFSDLRSEARLRPRRPLSLPYGLGATGRMLFWVPDQNNALRFSGFQPEARLRATLGQDAPHGRGVSDPSPCAPPRQAGKPGPIGHRVVGFCGTAWGEWEGLSGQKTGRGGH